MKNRGREPLRLERMPALDECPVAGRRPSDDQGNCQHEQARETMKPGHECRVRSRPRSPRRSENETSSRSNQQSVMLKRSSMRGARPRIWRPAMRIIPPRKNPLTTVESDESHRARRPAEKAGNRRAPAPRPRPGSREEHAVHKAVCGHHDQDRQRPDEGVLLVETPGLFDDPESD